MLRLAHAQVGGATLKLTQIAALLNACQLTLKVLLLVLNTTESLQLVLFEVLADVALGLLINQLLVVCGGPVECYEAAGITLFIR